MTLKRTELQRLLSKRGVASRSQAAALIKGGKVKVNGKKVTDPRAYVTIDVSIEVDGALIETDQETLLIAFHKPKGVVTTSSDEKGRKTVYELLPEQYRNLKAIGRLDMASTGLLLFTNDNALADRLLDPKNQIPKTYVVTVEGKPSDEDVKRLRSGIKDQGEFLKALSVEVRKTSNKESILIMTLTEGKNREIRRMCSAIDHEVMKLKRIKFGDIELGDLAVGAVRECDRNEGLPST